MRLLFLIALLFGAGWIGYRLGRRGAAVVTVHEPARRPPPRDVSPARPAADPADDRRRVVEAAEDLGRWLEGAGQASAEVSPATWDRISEAAGRIAAAAGRLSTRRN